MCVKSLSRVRLFATPWTVAHQTPLSMGFSRQEYWSGLPFPSPGDLPNPGIQPGSPALQSDALSSEPQFDLICLLTKKKKKKEKEKKDYKREALLTTMTLCSLGMENQRNVTAVKDWRRSKQRIEI